MAAWIAFDFAWPSAGVISAGIASAEAFGQPAISATISLLAIPSAEAFGSDQVSSSIATAGIAGAEAFGSPAIAAAIVSSGIPSAETFGAPAIQAQISGAGIPSAQVFGALTITGGQPVTQAAGGTGGGGGHAEEYVPIRRYRYWQEPEPANEIVAIGIASEDAFGKPTVHMVRSRAKREEEWLLRRAA